MIVREANFVCATSTIDHDGCLQSVITAKANVSLALKFLCGHQDPYGSL